ncbi:MAG: uracil-DNA glycosylase family protein [Spirochaetota bacterium]
MNNWHDASLEQIVESTRGFARQIDELTFSRDDITVYNPLHYAWEPHEYYLRKFAAGPKQVLFLGMNPGPNGMAQTGIPFGDPVMVSRWLNIEGSVGKPVPEHPKRPVEGFQTAKREPSGTRLWSLMQEEFVSAERFFSDHMVLNYCPLCFMEESGRNLTPDKLPSRDKNQLESICDAYLLSLIDCFKPLWLVGIGRYAEKKFHQIRSQLDGTQTEPTVGWVLHPSPASPAANRGWASAARTQLIEQGVWSS